MTTALQLRRGTTAQHSTFTGANGEMTVDTTKKTAVVHDGVTPGGTPLAKEADALNRVRFDVSTQGLNDTQKSNARTNIDAAKDPGANGWIVRTGAGTTAARSLVAGSGISISNRDGTAGNPTISNSGVLSVNGQTGNVTVAVDTSNKVSKTGDTMTGNLIITTGGLQLYGWRGNNTQGVVFLNANADRYLYYDGSNYIMPGANLLVNGAYVLNAVGGGLSRSNNTVSLNAVHSGKNVTNTYSNAISMNGGSLPINGAYIASLNVDAYGRVVGVGYSYGYNCNCCG